MDTNDATNPGTTDAAAPAAPGTTPSIPADTPAADIGAPAPVPASEDPAGSLIDAVTKGSGIQFEDDIDVLDPASEPSPPDGAPAPKPADKKAEADNAKADAAEKADKKDTAQPPDAAASGDAPGDGQDAEDDEDDDTPDDGQVLLSAADMRRMGSRIRKKVRRLQDTFVEAHNNLVAAGPLVDMARELRLPMDNVRALSDVARKFYSGDMEGFLSALAPYVEQAQNVLGWALPPDLQQKVEDGYLTEEDAAEMAQLRAKNASLVQSTQQQATQQQRQAEASLGDAQARAVNAWETQVRQRDPDFDAKQQTVTRFAVALAQEHGRPRTPEQAVQLVQAAYDEANKVFAQAVPTPKPTRATPSSAGSVSTQGARAEPASFFDAALAGLERARAPQ